MLGDFDRERPELILTALAVRKARRVAQVEVVLARQRDQQLVQDGQSTDTGIEHADRLLRDWGHAAAWCQRRVKN